MWNLISIMDDTISVWNKGRHVSCKLIVSYSWLAHCVELLDISINFLNICSCHYTQGPSQAMPSDHKLTVPVECNQITDLSINLSLNTVKSLIEANMNGTTVAKIITGPCCLQIENPVRCINTSSKSDDDALVFRRVSDKAIHTVTVITYHFCIFKLDVFAVIAGPTFD